MEKIKRPMTLLTNGDDLPETCLDHSLKGGWKGCRDLHIEPDWVLIYALMRML